MKRLGFFLVIAVLLASAVFAQGRDNWRGERKMVTVNGALRLENGIIALGSGDNAYYVPMLMRYTGFIDGLKEGANVSVEGYAFNKVLHPVKVTINGKAYEFGAESRGQMFGGNGFGQGYNQGNNNYGFDRRGGFCPGCDGQGFGRSRRGNNGWGMHRW
jgi:hypothetical protein